MSNAKRKSLRGVSHFIGNDHDDQQKPTSAEDQKSTSVETKNRGSTELEKNTSTEEQKKVGYYLPSSLTEELEESWFRARRLTKENISKSDFVRAAIEEAIEDFERHGEEGTFAQRLMSQSS